MDSGHGFISPLMSDVYCRENQNEEAMKEARVERMLDARKKGKLFDLKLFLKDVGDARKIRSRLLACFEAAALPTTTDERRKQLLNFAVVGGGPTGIEFSAELHDIIHEDLARIYPDLIPFHKITVYDVAKKVLPLFDGKLAKYAVETFKREAIKIKTGHHVEELRPGAPEEDAESAKSSKVFTLKVKEEGEMGVGMVVWSTPILENSPGKDCIPVYLEQELQRKLDIPYSIIG